MANALDIIKKQQHYKKMTESPIRRLILKMSVPTIASMIVITLYGVVDSYFVSAIGVEAVAGVGVSTIFTTFINALSALIGAGSGIFIAHALGAQQNKDANEMAATSFYGSVFFGVVVAIVSVIFVETICYWGGATEEIMPYATDYLIPIALMTPFFICTIVLTNHLRMQGKMVYAMIGVLSGAIFNVAFDPIFIMVFDMGVKGAAYATCLSQILSTGFLLYGTIRKGSVHIRIKNFKTNKGYLSEIIKIGFPAFSRQIVTVISVTVINNLFRYYSSPELVATNIAAFFIVYRIMLFVMSGVIGLGQTYQSVCSFNYGARLYSRVLKGYLFCIQISFCFLVLVQIIGLLFAENIVSFFTDGDIALIETAVVVMRWQCIFLPWLGACTMTNMITQNIGLTWQAVLLSISRHGLCFIPVAFILPRLFGIYGLQIAQGVSDGLTVFLTVPFVVYVIRLLQKNIEYSEKDQYQEKVL